MDSGSDEHSTIPSTHGGDARAFQNGGSRPLTSEEAQDRVKTLPKTIKRADLSNCQFVTGKKRKSTIGSILSQTARSRTAATR